MIGRFIATGVLLLAALVIVNARISLTINLAGRRRRALAYMQNLPAECEMLVEVAKRDGSNEVAFQVCVRSGDICTSVDVPTCTADKKLCEGFKPDSVDDKFKEKYPDAYAKVCEDDQLSEKELCLHTDIVYHTCGAAKVQTHELCLPLANGELECAEIPEEERLMIESLNNPAPSARYGWPPRYPPAAGRIQQFINRED